MANFIAMKFFYIFLLFVCLPFLGISQIKIEGFGNLKLGMNISEIKELNPKNDTIKKIYTREEEYEFQKGRVTQISPVEIVSSLFTKNFYYNYDSNSFLKYIFFGVLDERVRLFKIDKLKINDSVNFNNVSLYFFKNKLYRIETKDDNLDKLIEKNIGTKFNMKKRKFNSIEDYFLIGYYAHLTSDSIKNYQTGIKNYKLTQEKYRWDSQQYGAINRDTSYYEFHNKILDIKIEKKVNLAIDINQFKLIKKDKKSYSRKLSKN
jgi:hypothetical protein